MSVTWICSFSSHAQWILNIIAPSKYLWTRCEQKVRILWFTDLRGSQFEPLKQNSHKTKNVSFWYSYISLRFLQQKHADTPGQNHSSQTQSEPEYRVHKPQNHHPKRLQTKAVNTYKRTETLNMRKKTEWSNRTNGQVASAVKTCLEINSTKQLLGQWLDWVTLMGKEYKDMQE